MSISEFTKTENDMKRWPDVEIITEYLSTGNKKETTRVVCCTVDIDECSAGSLYCPQNATCDNTDGGYECYCDPGFKLVHNVGCFGNYCKCLLQSANNNTNNLCLIMVKTNRSTLRTVYNIQQSATQGSNDTTRRPATHMSIPERWKAELA